MVAIFEAICERTHKTLISEICPWCGHGFVYGERANHVELSTRMDYVRLGLLGLGDSWLAERIREWRSGDKDVRRSILSACITLLAEVTTQWGAEHPEVDENRIREISSCALFELLNDLLTNFQGSSAQEFCDQLKAKLIGHLQHRLL
ncbi:MAG: hypothetical protein WD648_12205 [Planctomycetaceae bacterium]